MIIVCVFVIDRIVDSVGNIGCMQFAVQVKETSWNIVRKVGKEMFGKTDNIILALSWR